MSGKSKYHLNSTRITGTLREEVFIFVKVSPRVLLGMRNVSNKSCGENQNTHFTFNKFFRKLCVDNVEKCGGASEAADNVAHARCMLDK